MLLLRPKEPLGELALRLDSAHKSGGEKAERSEKA